MPGAVSEGPSVALSFANNFWGKDDAGVDPLLERMHNAKQTCDELKNFYNARSALEEEYARKLLALSRKPLGSQETGTLRTSMDVVRGEVESMGKSHQNIAQQMKTELEEPLAAFAGAMKERRKIVQNGIEKVLKTKIQQTQQVNKTRDKYEQECLKIKGYLAQGHMVMGQEERKNKAKLEKTQINVATSNTEYEAAVKILEETTGRWNRDWKAAADKFQDLEEERLDFTKSSLWTFANIASTVCVSDDASCEKIRLALENCEVEKDIISFIKDRGTGQEIPDPPKYINFCRGDGSDSQSEASEDDHYSVAQFQRTINPAFRTSSPQPSTYESHHDPKSSLARELGHKEPETPPSREVTLTPQKALADRTNVSRETTVTPQKALAETKQPQLDYTQEPSKDIYRQEPSREVHRREPSREVYRQEPSRDVYRPEPNKDVYRQETSRDVYRQEPSRDVYRQEPSRDVHRREPSREVYRQEPSRDVYRPEPSRDVYRQESSRDVYRQEPNRDVYRQEPSRNYKQEPSRLQYDPSHSGPLATVPHDPYPMDGMTMLCRTGPPSDMSSHSGLRPSSRDSRSEYSNPTSFSSIEPPSGKQSPVKQDIVLAPASEKSVQKKKSGFFQSHSPFRRKSKHEKETPSSVTTPSNRNTWSASKSTSSFQNTASRRSQMYGSQSQNVITDRQASSPEPIDPRASFQLNVGNNVFDVARPDKTNTAPQEQQQEELDPIAQALAELKGVTKQSSSRVSADHYSGMATPAPDSTSVARSVPAPIANGALMAGLRGTPPPSYDQPVSRLGLPQPAFTSKAMQKTSQKYQTQTQNMFSTSHSRSESQSGYGSKAQSRPGTRANDIPRAISPQPLRSVSPRPSQSSQVVSSDSRQSNRSVSPNPYGGSQQGAPQQSIQPLRAVSPKPSQSSQVMSNDSRQINRSVSPNPYGGSQRGPPQQSIQPLRSVSPKPSPSSQAVKSDPRQSHRSVSPNPYGGSGRGAPQQSIRPLRSASPKPNQSSQAMNNDPRQGHRSVSPNPYGGSQQGAPQQSIQPLRSVSPRPSQSSQAMNNDLRQGHRSVSPNPYGGSQRGAPQQSTQQRSSDNSYYRHNSPGDTARAVSPAPFQEIPGNSYASGGEMSLQLAPVPDDGYGSQRGRNGGGRPTTSGNRSMSYYGGPSDHQAQQIQLSQVDPRQRSKSVADIRQYNREGRPILHFARAQYNYTAAIPEELSFAKGDMLAVLRLQDDGWWEAEVAGKNQRPGLVPSNYVQVV